MYDTQVILELVGLIYDASLNQERWPAFLTRLTEVTQGTSAVIYQFVPFKEANVAASIRIDPASVRAYEKHYMKINVLSPRALCQPEGSAFTRQTVCSDEEMLRLEYYNDYLRPLGIFHSMNGQIFNRAPVAANIDIFRPATVEPFGDRECALLKVLLPHLQRAFSVHQRMATLVAHQKATTDALNRLPIGLVLQDDQGKICLLNLAAQAILEQKDGLYIERHGLKAANRDENQQLHTMIATASSISLGRGFESMGALAISRPSMRRPYALIVSPLPRKRFPSPFEFEEAVVALFINDPNAQNEPLEDVLGSVFALTRAESRLAAILAQGKSLEEACDTLCISRETGRTHLKHIFGKTQTNRQGELIRLLLKCPVLRELR